MCGGGGGGGGGGGLGEKGKGVCVKVLRSVCGAHCTYTF